jgi:hypothetical protein
VWNTGNSTDPLLIAHPAVEQAKSYLGNLYGYTPAMDEFYGAKSADVVAQFQKTFMGAQLQKGTVQTGVLDQQTLDQLKQAYENKQRTSGAWAAAAKAEQRDGQTGYGLGSGAVGSVGTGGSGSFGSGGSSGVQSTNNSNPRQPSTVASTYIVAKAMDNAHQRAGIPSDLSTVAVVTTADIGMAVAEPNAATIATAATSVAGALSRNATSVAADGGASFTVSRKHLASAGGRYQKFATDSTSEVSQLR